MLNRATQYLEQSGESLESWYGQCSALADTIIEDGDNVVYVEGDVDMLYSWWYHQVIMRDGLVHDAWCPKPEPLPINEWLLEMFGIDAEITVTIDAEDVFSGLSQDFTVH